MAQPWEFDETQQVGVNYHDECEAKRYDEKMQRLRNIPGEVDEIAEALLIGSDSVVWDIGTGTGEIALGLAARCRQVHATDISEAMLACARAKLETRSVANIAFRLGGFISGFEPDETVDAVVSQLALHHLPDFWKDRALARISRKLKPGGRFFLRDVVFDSEIEDFETFITTAMEVAREKAGDTVALQTAEHIRDEYSTFDWILEGMFERNGFSVIRKTPMGFLTVYVCEKTA